MTEETYISVQEAATLLRVSTRQVHRYSSGPTPRIRKRRQGRFVQLNKADVEALVDELTRLSSQRSIPKIEVTESRTVDELLASEELLSLAEAAKRAGLSMRTLQGYVRRGRLRARKVGSQWVTTRAALEEYLASRNLKAVPRKYRAQD